MFNLLGMILLVISIMRNQTLDGVGLISKSAITNKTTENRADFLLCGCSWKVYSVSDKVYSLWDFKRGWGE